MLALLGSNHVNLASHLDRTVESVDRIASVVPFAVTLQFTLIDVVSGEVRGVGQLVVVSVLATDAAGTLLVSLEWREVLVLAPSRSLLVLAFGGW